jgi:hypothetical protein
MPIVPALTDHDNPGRPTNGHLGTGCPKDEVLRRLRGVVPGQDGHTWSALCPAHEDRHPSLSVSVNDDGTVLLKCHRGCTAAAVVAAIGLGMTDLFPAGESGAGPGTIDKTYDYVDEHGELLFQVVRFRPKKFRQRRPDGRGGWVWNLKGVRRVLYSLPDLVAAPAQRAVFVVEGEKDADRLTAEGQLATTCPGGAEKWRREYSGALAGRNVAILPDNDEPGRAHAIQVARSLGGVANAVKVLHLPGLPLKGDVSDWLDSGHTVSELWALVRETPVFDAAAGGPDDDQPDHQRDDDQPVRQRDVDERPDVDRRRREPGEGADRWTLGTITVRPEAARRTRGGKLIVPLVVLHGDRPVDRLSLPETVSGRKEVAKALCRLAGEGVSLDAVLETLGRILVSAATLLDGRAAPEGPKVWEVVAAKVPDALQLVCRTDKGLWSEARGREVGRAEFVTHHPPWLLKLAGQASDAPRDAAGDAIDQDVLRLVKTGLEVLWADLYERLPTLSGADLGKATKAGQAFRGAMEHLWHALCTGEAVKSDTGDEVLSKASLVRRVKKQAKAYLEGKASPDGRERWRPIHESMQAFWRPGVTRDGVVVVWLAMRWQLTQQARVDLPGVTDQASLHKVGEMFGVLDPDPPVPRKLSGGKAHLAVLDQDFTLELLGDPEEDDGEDAEPSFSDSVTG